MKGLKQKLVAKEDQERDCRHPTNEVQPHRRGRGKTHETELDVDTRYLVHLVQLICPARTNTSSSLDKQGLPSGLDRTREVVEHSELQSTHVIWCIWCC
jgi:hypothetical protein